MRSADTCFSSTCSSHFRRLLAFLEQRRVRPLRLRPEGRVFGAESRDLALERGLLLLRTGQRGLEAVVPLEELRPGKVRRLPLPTSIR